MRTPIIEVREQNLFVLDSFDGVVESNVIKTRHNLRGNRVRHVIDSSGAHWALHFERTDRQGLRRVVAAVWNICSDYYTFEASPNITIGEFRRIVEPHLRSANPDIGELASSLIAPLSRCPESDTLGPHMPSLNL